MECMIPLVFHYSWQTLVNFGRTTNGADAYGKTTHQRYEHVDSVVVQPVLLDADPATTPQRALSMACGRVEMFIHLRHVQ